jgi:hypothetical protein
MSTQAQRPITSSIDTRNTPHPAPHTDSGTSGTTASEPDSGASWYRSRCVSTPNPRDATWSAGIRHQRQIQWSPSPFRATITVGRHPYRDAVGATPHPHATRVKGSLCPPTGHNTLYPHT